MAKLGKTDLDVSGLCLGGNILGWTLDDGAAFAVLDAFAAAGGNFLDTADVYSLWVPGNTGGDSERVLGRWMKARGNRESMVVSTKVGMMPGRLGLSPANLRTSVEGSLKNLGTDYIDLYYAHADDPHTPMEDTLAAFDALAREGKIRYFGASNFTGPRLAQALTVSDREGLARYSVLQNQYNLMERAEYERDVMPLLEREGVAGVPFYSLAHGFLSGKYRPGAVVQSIWAGAAAEYRNARGYKVIETLDEIAAAHKTSVAAASLAWMAAQPTIAAPVASASKPEQVLELMTFTELVLTADELSALDAVSAY
ncbi:MAG: aldo/keto reductase [Actinocrinis sp.]